MKSCWVRGPPPSTCADSSRRDRFVRNPCPVRVRTVSSFPVSRELPHSNALYRLSVSRMSAPRQPVLIRLSVAARVSATAKKPKGE